MNGCELCGNPTKSHTAGEIAICHSCFSEEEDLARSLLAEAEGKAEEDDEMEEVFEQLPKHETEDAFYTDFTPLYDALRDSVDDIRDATPPPDEVIQELRDLLSTADDWITGREFCGLIHSGSRSRDGRRWTGHPAEDDRVSARLTLHDQSQ